jgi:hypothetical protein
MRDKALETQLRVLTLQLDNWKKLHDLITYGLDKARPIISANRSASSPNLPTFCRKANMSSTPLGCWGDLSGRR